MVLSYHHKLYVLLCFTVSLISVTLTNFKAFDHHIHLPHLCTHLYWSYNPVNFTLAVNFQASSAVTPTGGLGSGWVALGVNPNGSGLMGNKLTQAVLSFDATDVAVDESCTSSGVNVVGFESWFDSESLTFEADIVLPEKIGNISQVMVMIGNGSVKQNLLEANLKFFGVLDLTEAKDSNLSKYVDGLLRSLSFERGCNPERNSIWDEYVTLNNLRVACNYGILLIFLLCIEPKEDKMYWFRWKLFGGLVVIVSLCSMYISLAIKANWILKFSAWNPFAAFWQILCCFMLVQLWRIIILCIFLGWEKFAADVTMVLSNIV